MYPITPLAGRVALLTLLSVYLAVSTIPSQSTREPRRNEAQASDGTKQSNTASEFIADQLRLGKKPNRLLHEKSPYLLQHAFNPVDWYPWGEEAFKRAKQEDKPIFLSVGYSTCYWCHVMEREVFENEEIAALMNRTFINVKVDREERPDVDRIYMSVLIAMQRSGGWPMSLLLTPDLKPFFAGSYIPRDRFRNLIETARAAWREKREDLLKTGSQAIEALRESARLPKSGSRPESGLLKSAFEEFRISYDNVYGGFGGRPKFPRPATLDFLLRFYARSGDRAALDMTTTTLKEMRAGGIYDHLGGGFHRYSVDQRWRVPHFEKMLYDQAQLISVYLDAYRVTRDPEFSATARECLDYVLRALRSPEGAFFSAEDAESVPATGNKREKEEGAFYVWTRGEIEQILGKERADVFAVAYGIALEGNALEDPHGVFNGKNILYAAHKAEEVAARFGRSREDIERVLLHSRARLLDAREKRPRPHLDDKILTSWNGLMIAALARASQVLHEKRYLSAAEEAADFILGKLYDAKSKHLLRRYRERDARFAASLEDYAFLVMGLLDLYEASLDLRWLRTALELTEIQNAVFYDWVDGGYYDTSGKDPTILFRTKEDYDGAEPAGNSVAVQNLLRLAEMTDNAKWREMSAKSLALFAERIRRQLQSMPQMLAALDFHLDKPRQIVVAGRPGKEDVQAMLRAIHAPYIPNKVILFADSAESQNYLSRYLPFLKSVRMLDGRATVYVCQDYACKLPTTDLAELKKQLQVKVPR